MSARTGVTSPGVTSLRVLVKDTGGIVVSGAEVSSTSQPSGQSALVGSSATDGSLIFVGVQPGNYTLRAEKNGYTNSSKIIVVVEGEVSELIIDLSLTPTTGSLRVTVKDSNGNKLMGAVVSSTKEPSGQTALSGITGADGTVTFTGLVIGNYTFRVSGSGYVSGSAQGAVASGVKTELSSTLQAQPSSGGIPGFPYEAIIVGVVLCIIWDFFMSYHKQH